MDLSGLIFVALAVAWAAYLIPKALRHHDDVAGRGVMPTAVALVIDHCFRSAGLHRIEIAIRPENSNSLRVVEKLGIREVGYAPRFLHIDGGWRDHRLYAITVEECPEGMLARLSPVEPQQSHE